MACIDERDIDCGHNWGYESIFFKIEANSLVSIMKMFKGKKTGFRYHEGDTIALLLMNGKAKLRLCNPSESWFEEIEGNPTIVANWHDLADIREMGKRDFFVIYPRTVYQIECEEDCEILCIGAEEEAVELMSGN